MTRKLLSALKQTAVTKSSFRKTRLTHLLTSRGLKVGLVLSQGRRRMCPEKPIIGYLPKKRGHIEGNQDLRKHLSRQDCTMNRWLEKRDLALTWLTITILIMVILARKSRAVLDMPSMAILSLTDEATLSLPPFAHRKPWKTIWRKHSRITGSKHDGDHLIHPQSHLPMELPLEALYGHHVWRGVRRTTSREGCPFLLHRRRRCVPVRLCSRTANIIRSSLCQV